MSTIFTKIINREIPSNIVWEDDFAVVFLDIQPIKKGHLLVVPKQEVDKFYDLVDESFCRLFLLAKFLAKKMESGLQQKFPELDVARIGLMIEGLDVNHVHIKLVPLSKGVGFNPSNAYQATPEELAEMRDFYTQIFAEL